jgi:hypothetical protein
MALTHASAQGEKHTQKVLQCNSTDRKHPEQENPQTGSGLMGPEVEKWEVRGTTEGCRVSFRDGDVLRMTVAMVLHLCNRTSDCPLPPFQ